MRHIALVLLALLFAAPVWPSTYTVDSTGDAADASAGDDTCATAGAVCTLRAAIQEANAHAGTDTIAFDISGAGPHTISPASVLPPLTEQVTIDGTTQSGSDCTMPPTTKVTVNGSGVGMSQLFTFSTGSSNSVIQGLSIIDSLIDGVHVHGAVSGLTIRCNVITGNEDGVFVTGPNNTVGGAGAGDGNLIAANLHHGVHLFSSTATGNLVAGNRIGTTANGLAANGNVQDGIRIANEASNNTIGGAAAAHRNLTSASADYGVNINNANCSGNTVQNNWVGLDADGNETLCNKAGSIQDLGTGSTITDNSVCTPEPIGCCNIMGPQACLDQGGAIGTTTTADGECAEVLFGGPIAEPACDAIPDFLSGGGGASACTGQEITVRWVESGDCGTGCLADSATMEMELRPMARTPMRLQPMRLTQ